MRMEINQLLRTLMILGAICALIGGCATTTDQIRTWEREGNIAKLSEVAQTQSEPAQIRKKSLESLARLNWEPSNPERLQVYAMFASEENYAEAESLMQSLSAEKFTEIDKAVVDCAELLTTSGQWLDRDAARTKYENLLALDNKAVTISICQQVAARQSMQIQLVLLAVKLGIPESEDELVAVLFEYGNKRMAEDFLNSGSAILSEGGRKWANSHGYNVQSGFGSNRAGWGRF